MYGIYLLNRIMSFVCALMYTESERDRDIQDAGEL